MAVEAFLRGEAMQTDKARRPLQNKTLHTISQQEALHTKKVCFLLLFFTAADVPPTRLTLHQTRADLQAFFFF